jgi:hypothetical protein
MALQAQHTYTSDDQLDLVREWDAAGCGSGREDLLAWLQKERPHLLRAYDAEFLLNAAERARQGSQRSR